MPCIQGLCSASLTAVALCTLVLTSIALQAAFYLSGQPIAALAKPQQYLFVFGDSYTTTGFNYTLRPQPSLKNPLGNPEYPGARTSGGDIWLDIVVRNYTQKGVGYNFAVGGDYVNCSRAQVGSYLPDFSTIDFRDQQAQFERLIRGNGSSIPWTVPWAGANSIFMTWFGVNDVTVQVRQGRDFGETKEILRPDVGDYFGLLERQYRLGARKFITLLVPPIHRAGMFGWGNTSDALQVKRAAQYWNEQVIQQNRVFSSRHPSADTRVVDPSPLFNNMLDNPLEYGAPNSTCESDPKGQPCLWHDAIHPGVVFHREFGKQVGEEVRAMLAERGAREDI